MAKSKIIINIHGDPKFYSSIALNSRHKDTPPNSAGMGTPFLYEQFYCCYQYDGSRIQYKSIVVVGNPTETAKNFITAWSTDDPVGFALHNVTRVNATITIEAKLSCMVFVQAIISAGDVGYTVVVENEDCVDDTVIVSETIGEADSDQCNKVKLTLETNQLITSLSSPEVIANNTDNPLILTLNRGENVSIVGIDINGNPFTRVVLTPDVLDDASIQVITLNQREGSKVTVDTSTSLVLMYKMDTGAWQTSNEFFVPLDADYTLYVKDEYGCEISKDFSVEDFYENVPTLVTVTRCSSLHELNVGKYLNLCGKQYTMKIGFVTNMEPNSIKIFKHIQMVLSTDYSVSNICVKTSNDQERFISGEHMVYRIREGMHSVPLKNPEDFDDLRGSWAYLEIEIESINNKKVDLFSVITHLRKSII